MNENTKNLLELIQQNPDLPIVPMVDAEIVNGDDWGRWMGSFGAARVLSLIHISEPTRL